MTIAAISTPNAAGGIGIVRLSGDDAIAITEKCFRSVNGKKLSQLKGYTGAFGDFFDDGNKIDECIVFIYRAPKSYTGEDVTEICCHGGLYIMQRVLRAVLSAGAVAAGPGEFTKRAFLNGKMDLTQAESVMNIISAEGEAALTAARTTLEGNVAKQIDEIAGALLVANGSLAAWADYPDEDIPAVDRDNLLSTLSGAKENLSRLIKNYDNGKAVTQGVNTVICGKPNVGKSTLMNLLSGCRKSIVTPVAGTTRDIVEETVRLGDILLRLSDTAGIRQTEDEVESIGVDMARQAVENADLVLAVFDISRPLEDEDTELLERLKEKKHLAVINKTDLNPDFNTEEIKKYTDNIIGISANNPDSLSVLEKSLSDILGCEGLDFNSGMLAGERQLSCAQSALGAICRAMDALNSGMTLDAVNVETDCALEGLYALTGKSVKEETVNEVFRKFCVGK